MIGQRVSPESELEGLDLPEMGAAGYPEFVLKAYRQSLPVSGVGEAAQA